MNTGQLHTADSGSLPPQPRQPAPAASKPRAAAAAAAAEPAGDDSPSPAIQAPKDGRASKAFLPFSDGMKNCLGQVRTVAGSYFTAPCSSLT